MDLGNLTQAFRYGVTYTQLFRVRFRHVFIVSANNGCLDGGGSLFAKLAFAVRSPTRAHLDLKLRSAGSSLLIDWQTFIRGTPAMSTSLFHERDLTC
jgi:hypothetical protein